MSSSTSFDNAILDEAFNGPAYTQPANLYVALYSTSPTANTAGTELSGNGYARVEVTFAAASAGSKSSNVDVTFSATGNAWVTAVAMAVVDASTSGNILVYKTLTPTRALDVGDTLTFNSGNITITLS